MNGCSTSFLSVLSAAPRLRLNVATSDSFNKHCIGVRDNMRALEGMTLSVPQLLAAIATSLCEAHSGPRINNAFCDIQEAVETGDMFDFKFVTKKISKQLEKKRAGSWSSVEDSDALALRSMATPTGPKCHLKATLDVLCTAWTTGLASGGLLLKFCPQPQRLPHLYG